MSRIDELIAEHCPDGVRYLEIGSPRVSERVVSGATPKTGRAEYWENGTIPWMSSGEVNKGIIYATNQFITQAAYEATSTKMVPAGAVVIALAGQGKTRGTVARTRIELCTNQSLASIVVAEGMDSDFLYHFLKTQYLKLRDVSSGEGTRGGLNLQMIRTYKVPVPPLEVQRAIVEILDTFSKLQTELEAELEARRQQYEHYLSHVFSHASDPEYDWTPLEQLAEVRDGTHDSPKRSSTGFPLVTSKNITTGAVDLSSAYLISESDFHEVNRRSKVGQWNLLLSMIGTVGEVAIVEDEPNFAIKNVGLIKSETELLSRYLAFYLRTSAAKEFIKASLSGTAQKYLTLGALRKLLVPLPPPEEQQRVVTVLGKFDALVNDLSIGLPAELAARRQQYEYYRDKLLTFKALEGAA